MQVQTPPFRHLLAKHDIRQPQSNISMRSEPIVPVTNRFGQRFVYPPLLELCRRRTYLAICGAPSFDFANVQ